MFQASSANWLTETDLANCRLMTMSQTGKIGIGTGSPLTKLHVFDTFSSATAWSGRALLGNQLASATIGVYGTNVVVGATDNRKY